jgi:hypothetical protein
MSLRIDLACAVMAALALIVADVTSARAVVQICDVMPERCYYGSDGRWYYRPPPYPVPNFTGTPRNRAVRSPRNKTVRSRGPAAWGCGALGGESRGQSWGFSNRVAASQHALSECTKRSTGTCRLLGCSSSVHSQSEAQAIWSGD